MTPYYLDAKVNAKTLNGDGSLSQQLAGGSPSDSYTYDPSKPTPAWINSEEKWSPQDLQLDQRFVQMRDDVLVYTSEPLTESVEILGTPSATLYIRSDG